VRIALQALTTFDGLTTDAILVLDAYELAPIEQLSWCDGLIAKAAIRSHCDVSFGEQFGHGRKPGELTLCNLFGNNTAATP